MSIENYRHSSVAFILTPVDTIIPVEFKDSYNMIVDAVSRDEFGNSVKGGAFFSSSRLMDIELPSGKASYILYYNDEFLIQEDEKFELLNAAASLAIGNEIRGCVIAVKTDELGNSSGFDAYIREENGETILYPFKFDETDERVKKLIDLNADKVDFYHDLSKEVVSDGFAMLSSLSYFIHENTLDIENLHKKYDYNKSKPQYRYGSFSSIEEAMKFFGGEDDER